MSIWWEHFREVKKINERKIVWKRFQKYFKQKYLSDQYYDDKIKEFHELRLGQQTMEEYANEFLELLRYLRYIKYEKVKIQCFLSGLPQSYKDRIELYELRTPEEVIRKDKYLYEKRKRKPDYQKAWKDKKNEKYDQRKKGFKPYNFRNQRKQPTRVVGENTREPQQNKGPLQCWKCGGPHMRRNCQLENENARPTYNIQEVETVGQVARVIPRIYATLEDCQEDHQ